jgi:hypothetical protein
MPKFLIDTDASYVNDGFPPMPATDACLTHLLEGLRQWQEGAIYASELLASTVHAYLKRLDELHAEAAAESAHAEAQLKSWAEGGLGGLPPIDLTE